MPCLGIQSEFTADYELADNVAWAIPGSGDECSGSKTGSARGRSVEPTFCLPASGKLCYAREFAQTLLAVGKFNHWITPIAKDMDIPNLNDLTPISS